MRLTELRRTLELFARGLLDREVPVRSAPEGVTRAFTEAGRLFLPTAHPQLDGPLARQVHFAAVAHLAAHLRFGGPRLPRGRLASIQVVLVSLLEDARVERLAARELPGLMALWAPFHTAAAGDHPTFVALCARLSRALAFPGHADPHPLVGKARALLGEGIPSPETCRRVGSLLGNDIGQTRLSFDPRTYRAEPAYRDDHRLIWEEPPPEDRSAILEETDALERAAASRQAEREVGVARPANEPAPAGERIAARYPEWDYQIGTTRPAFVTVCEEPPPGAGDAPALAAHQATLRRIEWLARRLRLEALARRRRQRDGDTLDLDAAVAALVDHRAGRLADDAVHVRAGRRRQGLAVLLLLDLSASTAAPAGEGGRLLDLARDAALLLGHLLARAGELFAVHGFSSDGRHRVEYHRFKDLDQPWDGGARARLGAVAPRLSTRMGAALRHAGRHLAAARRERRLLILLTDGEPADVDAPDPVYLLHDARHAVGELRRAGLHPFAVSLDPAAQRYIPRIFGEGRSVMVDRVARLPEALPLLYARLAR